MCAKGLDLAAACKQNRHLRASSFWRPGIWRDGEKRGRSLAGFASEIATRCLGSGSVFLVVRFSQEIPWLSALAWCQQYVTVECYNVLAPASASISTACVVNASTRRIQESAECEECSSNQIAAGYTERLRVSTCCKLSASHPNLSVHVPDGRSDYLIQRPAWTPSRASDWRPSCADTREKRSGERLEQREGETRCQVVHGGARVDTTMQRSMQRSSDVATERGPWWRDSVSLFVVKYGARAVLCSARHLVVAVISFALLCFALLCCPRPVDSGDAVCFKRPGQSFVLDALSAATTLKAAREFPGWAQSLADRPLCGDESYLSR
ncbi:hypothetical protein CCMA1212_008160 [Trichoderma ghanense]|uniref:Transmembrane protein n=1 Tax=Trichoderma ghanense TaxID=65468 RepID=A0ABY2GVL5_9HYPO